ncbi:MAG TPA: DUF4293 domain-containing protein [Bacteroidales bacterium]|nr:DUF4293 domain-containing protein [Bacteroidales bacterium]
MIQRIQTVFLFIAVVAIGVMFFMPLADFFGDDFYFRLYINKVSDDTVVEVNTIPLIAISAVMFVLPLVAIFMYKKLWLQMRLVRFAILLNLAMIIMLYFGYTDVIAKQASVSVSYQAGVYFPLVSLVFLVLAMRFIVKDDKLLRNAGRLR